jgi:thioesterase domain-containing protein
MKQESQFATGITTNIPEELLTAPPTPPADEVYIMPATQGQIRFWSLDQMHPGNPALNMPLMWECRGELDIDLLARAFTQAVRRHEMLRTTFEVVDGNLSQIIGKPYIVALPVKDLQDVPEAVSSPQTDALIREHAAYRMDLRNGPLLVIKLLKFAPRNHLLLVTMHHIICDGISLGILLRDIAVLYEALVEGSYPDLPALPIQFADFAVWQEEWRKSEAAKTSLDFWRNTLGKDFKRIELPHDIISKGTLDTRTDSDSGDIETLLLSPELTTAAHELCRKQNVTLNILLFSIFCALLYRVTGERDLVVGSPCANRNEDTEELIGLLMNIQVLRVQIERGESFRALLKKVQDWTLGAYENQELPFEELIYDSHFSHRNTSFEIPIFFLYQKSFMVTQQAAGLEIIPLRSMSPGAVFEWMFAIVDRIEEGPRLQLEYNPNYFQSKTIARYLKSFVALLESAVQNPSVKLDDLAPADELLLSCLSEHSSPALDRNDVQRATARQIEDSTETIIEYGDRPNITNDPIELQLLQLWRSMLGIDHITRDTNVFSLGVSSLSILRLVTRMNSLYSMGFGLASLISAPTIKMVAGLVRTRYAPNTATSLVPIQPVGTRSPLYIVHGAGGNVVNFYGLTTRIGTDQPVYGVQAQALEPNQPALFRIEDMAAYYLKEIRRVQPRGPYHFLGYSFGGIVVLEMAHQLEAAGEAVGLLGMLDTRARERMGQQGVELAVEDSNKSNRLVGYFRRNFGDRNGRTWLEFFSNDLKERSVRYVTALSAKTFSKIPACLKDTFEINTFAARNYRLKPFRGRLTLFRATKQAEEGIPQDNGWGPIFTDGVEILEIPGDHWQVLSDPGIGVLAKTIHDCLGQFDKAPV